jgi:hypothetical protein
MQKNLENPLELSNLVPLWKVKVFSIEQVQSICVLAMTSDELAHYFTYEFHWQQCPSGDRLE